MSLKILLLPIIGVTTFFILLFTFTKIFGPIPFSLTSVTTQKTDTFNVSGEGKVTAEPDIASITAGITSNASSVKLAQDQINVTINKVSAALKALGIDPKDIQTTNYSIYPDYDYNAGRQNIKGYSANTSLLIKVRKIDIVNEVIDNATSNGANQINDISFDIDDREKLENEARKKAVEDAKKKAENAAKIAGFKLGKIINYSENFGGYPIPMPYRALGVEVSQDKSTQIEPGSTDIIINVTLSYEIL